jgi:hypothetical protein
MKCLSDDEFLKVHMFGREVDEVAQEKRPEAMDQRQRIRMKEPEGRWAATANPLPEFLWASPHLAPELQPSTSTRAAAVTQSAASDDRSSSVESTVAF